MQQVFISSIQDGHGDVRDAVRRAVDSLDMVPLMAELTGAHAESPQRALLDLVARCDLFLLLVGRRYSRPTEDEATEADRLGKPILVLRQTGELEPEQATFLERIAGGWSSGRLWGTYDGAHDVALAAVRALTNAKPGRSEDLAPRAQARAQELAGGLESTGFRQGSVARVAFAPLVERPVLDALGLDRPDLADAIADHIRTHRLVPHSVGIVSTITSEGVAIRTSDAYSNVPPIVLLGSDGAVLCEVDVAGADHFGTSRIHPERLRTGIVGVGLFALDVWEQIDERKEIVQVAAAVGIPGASSKVFGTPANSDSLQMGGNLPQVVVAPNTAVIVRRAELAAEQLATRLVAEVKRVFADANAVAQ